MQRPRSAFQVEQSRRTHVNDWLFQPWPQSGADAGFSRSICATCRPVRSRPDSGCPFSRFMITLRDNPIGIFDRTMPWSRSQQRRSSAKVSMRTGSGTQVHGTIGPTQECTLGLVMSCRMYAVQLPSPRHRLSRYVNSSMDASRSILRKIERASPEKVR